MVSAISILVRYFSILLTGGVVVAALNLLERRLEKQIPFKIYGGIVLVFLVWAALTAIRDEHHNAVVLTGEKADAWRQYNECDKQRAVKDMAVNILSGELAKEHTAQAEFQNSFNRQQNDITACVQGSIERLKAATQLTLIMAKLSDVDPRLGKRAAHFLLMSNRDGLNGAFRVHCNVDILTVRAGVIGQSTVMAGGGGGKIGRDFVFSIGAPPMGTTNPLDVVVYYNDEVEPYQVGCNISH